MTVEIDRKSRSLEVETDVESVQIQKDVRRLDISAQSSQAFITREVSSLTVADAKHVTIGEGGYELYQRVIIEGGFVYAGRSLQSVPDDDAAEWKISRLSVDNPYVDPLWADGTQLYDKQWSARGTYAYSEAA